MYDFPWASKTSNFYSTSECSLFAETRSQYNSVEAMKNNLGIYRSEDQQLNAALADSEDYCR